jgi:cytochrome c-type biogenesis protein CcmE
MKKGSIFGIVIIAIAIAVIISTYSSSSTYGTFKEAAATNTQLHIVGHLDKQKALFYDPVKDANYFSFYMTDNKGQECKVVFTGSKPQDFERSEQIVLTGQMNGSEFHASKILMKCPSKYTQDKVEVTEYKAKQATI